MDGLVTVRVPAGAIVRLSARELLAVERAAGRGLSPADASAPAALGEACEGAAAAPEAAPGWDLPAPAQLSAAVKAALKDWTAARGKRPKYITRQRVRDYVAATGDVTFRRLLEEAAPGRDADRPAPHAPGISEAEGGAA